MLRNLALLPVNISRIFRLHFELQLNLLALLISHRLDCLACADLRQSDDVSVAVLRPLQQVCGALQSFAFSIYGLALVIEDGPARIINESKLAANGRQPEIGVIFAQHQSILGTTREHAIRLADTACREIVDEHADIRFMTLRMPLIFLLCLPRRIQAGEQSLRRRLLVAGRAIDLAGKVQARNRLGLKRRLQVTRIEVVILNRIARLRDARFFKAANRSHESFLYISRQACRNAIRIDDVGRQPFGLDK